MNDTLRIQARDAALRECNFMKRDWFSGWYIGSTFHKASNQQEAEELQLDYELRLYFRNRGDSDEEEEQEEQDEEQEEQQEEDSPKP